MFMPCMHLLPSCKWPPLGHTKKLCLAVVLLMPFQDFLIVELHAQSADLYKAPASAIAPEHDNISFGKWEFCI